MFEKDTIDSKTGKHVSIYKMALFNGKAKTITKVDDLGPELNMSRQEILNTIDKWVSEGSGWVIDRIALASVMHLQLLILPSFRAVLGASFLWFFVAFYI